MTKQNNQDARIEAITGGNELSHGECFERFFQHLNANLQLPCDVTGSEDFSWEEYYVFGPGDPAEYKRLRKTQPSRLECLGFRVFDRCRA